MSTNYIKVPKPAGTAYNPNRPLEKNLLIQWQVQHFREAERQLPIRFQTGANTAKIRTEGQASMYIRQVTLAIHKAGGRSQPKVEHAA